MTLVQNQKDERSSVLKFSMEIMCTSYALMKLWTLNSQKKCSHIITDTYQVQTRRRYPSTSHLKTLLARFYSI